MDYELLGTLNASREYFKEFFSADRVFITITGGNRCLTHNEDVQKQYNKDYVPFSSKSQHILGKAVDHKHFRVINGAKHQIPPDIVYKYYAKTYPNKYGIGLYSNRVHLDVRTNKARWKA
jgi:uncharacterized protein YcbK (DUF882 family)